MSGKKVGAAFGAVFLLVMVVTLVVPTFPPAALLLEFLKIPQGTISIGGIPEMTLIDSITNGFFWLAIGATIYGLFSLASKGDPLPPMPDAPQLKTPPPEPMPIDNRTNKIPPALTIRKFGRRKPRTEYDIEMIEGIGPIRGALLRNLGVKTVDNLLKASDTKRGQQRLAKEAGVSDEMLQKWICRGDLLRIRGVGTQYSGLLESAGVNSVADLSTRNPSFLHQTLKIVNREKQLVRRIPPARTIRAWVNDAKSL
jgi:predicted flap endonuclease-1-like 5' DNA nuclease